ncbi:hypothetical protein BRC2024_KWYBBTRE_CDS_0069 [Acinetobacter phage vB_AbaM_AB-Navy-v2]
MSFPYAIEQSLRAKARSLRVIRNQIRALRIAQKLVFLSLERSVNDALSAKDYDLAKIIDRRKVSVENHIESLDKIEFYITNEQRNYGLVIQRIRTYIGQVRQMPYTHELQTFHEQRWAEIMGQAVEQLARETPWRFRHYTGKEQW